MKKLVYTALIFVLVKVSGGETPTMSIFTGNHITINVTTK